MADFTGLEKGITYRCEIFEDNTTEFVVAGWLIKDEYYRFVTRGGVFITAGELNSILKKLKELNKAIPK